MRWGIEGDKRTLEKIVNSQFESKNRYILDISPDAVLDCKLQELADLIIDIVKLDRCDTADLSNFRSIAVLYRTKKLGLPTIVVRPEPFKKKMLFGDRSVSKSEKSVSSSSGVTTLALRDDKNSTKGIKIAAFAFFVIVVLGLLFYAGTRRSGRSRSSK